MLITTTVARMNVTMGHGPWQYHSGSIYLISQCSLKHTKHVNQMKSNLEKFHLRTSFSCPDQINRMQFPRREKILLCGVSIIPTNMLHIVDMFSFIVELAMV